MARALLLGFGFVGAASAQGAADTESKVKKLPLSRRYASPSPTYGGGLEAMAVKELQVDVEGDDTIIISKPGTEFLVAYQMRSDEPFLIMTHSWIAPTIMSREITDFRAKAFAVALAKARELGWIV